MSNISESRRGRVAVTGSFQTPSMSPHLPITPEEVAERSKEAREILGTKGSNNTSFAVGTWGPN